MNIQDSLKEKLSALVDNELDELEERRVFTALENDAELRGTWERYHLVRAALRQDLEVVVAHGVVERVAARIATEHSSAAAFLRRRATRWVGTLAIAASVAAMAITGVQWLQQPTPMPLATLAVNTPAPASVIRSGTTRWDTKEPGAANRLNAYLVEHDEYASSAGIGGMMPYVRVVGYDNDK